MYRLFRDVHLVLALLSLPFLLVYGVSTVQLLHPNLFAWAEHEDQVERVIEVPEEARGSPRAVAQHLMARGVKGDLMKVESSSTAVKLRIVMPGTVHTAEFPPGAASVTVSSSVGGWVGLLNRLHHAGGMWHDYWGTNFWGWLVLFTSLALLGIGTSGIVLWYQRKKERLIGWGMLVISLVFGLGIVTLVRMS